MELIFNIPTNIMLAQFFGGVFTGLCCGIFIPSEYEKKFTFSERKKIWKWKKNEHLTLVGLFTYLIKTLFFIGVIAYINAEISRYFDAYPMFGKAVNSYIFIASFFIMVFIAKTLRYLYFKSKIQ